MIAVILDLVAPRAKAEVTFKLPCDYLVFLDYLKKCHKQKGRSSFRVNGNFFADLKAAQVAVGKKADPKHYSKVGFNLNVRELPNDKVLLRAEERIILGYLEKKAVGVAILSMLENLMDEINEKDA